MARIPGNLKMCSTQCDEDDEMVVKIDRKLTNNNQLAIRIKGLDNEDKFKMVFPTVSMIRVDEDETTRPMYVAALQRLERRRHFSEDRLDASVSDDSFGNYEYFDSLDFIPGQSFRDPDREIRPKINWRYILGYILMIHVLTRVLIFGCNDSLANTLNDFQFESLNQLTFLFKFVKWLMSIIISYLF